MTNLSSLSSNREASSWIEPQEFSGSGGHPWFAIHVKSNHEKAVCLHLSVKGFEVFLPVCRTRNRWADRFKIVETPLFRGYVFARLDPSRPNSIFSTPGVLKIVGTGRHPLPVAENEILAIRRAVDANLQLRECDFFTMGQRATVVGGTLAGLEGTVVRVKQKTRLVLSISLLQRSVDLEIDGNVVQVESDPAILQYSADPDCGGATPALRRGEL
jgi:transcription antitermination factor NusG